MIDKVSQCRQAGELVARIMDLMQERGLMAGGNDAKAVIAAMREPTQAMVMAAKDIPTQDHEEEMWKAMIDAALSEEVT